MAGAIVMLSLITAFVLVAYWMIRRGDRAQRSEAEARRRN